MKQCLEDCVSEDSLSIRKTSPILIQLSSVQELNERYKAAIELPSLRTPSQIKKLYEPVLEQEGMEVMEKYQPKRTFNLPEPKKPKNHWAQVGSAVHELMQRLNLSWLVTEDTVREAFETVQRSVD